MTTPNELNGEKLNKTKVIYNDSANNMLEGSYEENLPDAKNELNPSAEIKTEKEVPDNLEPDQVLNFVLIFLLVIS